MKEIYCIQVLNILAHSYTCLTRHFNKNNVRYKVPKDKDIMTEHFTSNEATNSPIHEK